MKAVRCNQNSKEEKVKRRKREKRREGEKERKREESKKEDFRVAKRVYYAYV